jgi:hypothetical protein
MRRSIHAFAISCPALITTLAIDVARAQQERADGGSADAGAAPADGGASSDAETETARICRLDPSACPRIELTGSLAAAPAAGGAVSVPGAKTGKAIIMPAGRLEIGGEMVLITSDATPYGPAVRFTDVGVLRLRARHSPTSWLEVFAGTELLAKQPSFMNDVIWQGGNLGARALLLPWLAVEADGRGGPLMGGGLFWAAEAGLLAKASVDYHVRFEVGLKDAFTALRYHPDVVERFWIDEIVARAEAQIGDRNGAMWVAIDYRVPLASNPPEPVPELRPATFLDPKVQLNLQVGGVMIAHNWDLYVDYTFIDRGDLSRPETTLRILDGGFDQQQLAIGVLHRFPKPSNDAYPGSSDE